MSGCIERHQVLSPMTGSMGTGHLRPQEEEPKTQRSTDTNSCELVSPHHRRSRARMTPVPLDNEKIDQPIQLTPLWEHVVRTQEFPQEVNKHSTFKEISERLRDPEWEVRQHALRVMIDVLPTLPKEQLDDILVPVVPELINNLGHLAPAVRKGALDALRVYLVCTEERERIVDNILQANLTRQDSLDPIKTSITQGLILSMPSLLFPSPSTPQPSEKTLKNSITSLSSHLIQVNHQESALKSLVKIRETIGPETFDSHLSDLNPNIKKDFDSLAQVYGIDHSPRRRKKPRKSPKKSTESTENRIEIETRVNNLETQENSLNSRVVLETEIKLNEETAITMTILERKHSESSDEGPEKGEMEAESQDKWIERRKTPRRVHFGGEIVKLRTPDSDDSIHTDVPTKIPLPIAPATKLPHRSRPSSMTPAGSVSRSKGIGGRKSRSASTSPKRGFYVHDGSLSPKKGILTKSSMNRDKSRSLDGNDFFDDADDAFGMKNDRSWSFEVFDDFDDKIDSQRILSVNSEKRRRKSMNSGKKPDKSEKNKVNEKRGVSKSECNSPINEKSDLMKRSASSIGLSELNDLINGKKKSPIPSPKRLVYETFPRKERNYILMELSSPVKINSRSREVSPVCEQVNGEVKSEDVKFRIEDNIENEIVNDNENFVSEKEDRVKSAIDNSEDNWEELGLVGQEVLDDLHNKDDWRARVRGLERVASALRTSSALISIEPRLGSLLQAVLGGERSCRVAAAAMSVARVVVAGVSEEALKRRLPQVAWGLSRQGGPNAAQLARVAMLRLRPALFLEQLLQPHCIDARNAKTRENALQLLIFSLVTFPSTEFKVENVANKVAVMVGDRRRRVRQAALDTLAVLAQIYEPEEVLQAGNRAAKQLNEGTDMVAAIRARLARKSLPMVSADGLVVYGLQISPTVQIATGPDVDWIVAGSGSVSPGTGRSRGQIIPPNLKAGMDKKNDQEKRAPSPKPNFVALGVGLSAKSERPVAWQLIQSDKEETNSSQEIEEDYRNESPISIETSSVRSRYEDPYSRFPTPQENPIDTYTEPVNSSNLKNEKDVIMKQRKTEENFHRRMDQIYGERREDIVRLESKIPVPNSRERHIVVRHSTAYQRRRRQVDEDEIQPSSAPHTSSGSRYGDFRDTDISRRYRSDRIQFSSRPPSEDRSRDSRDENSPVREGFESVYDDRRRRTVVRSSLAAEDVNNSPVDSRCNSSSHSGSMQPAFSPVQRSDPRTRGSHTPTSTRDKTNVGEEENNEKNRHYVSAQESPYRIETHSDQASQCSGTDHVPYEVSSDSSNGGNEDQANGEIETRIIEEPSEEDNEIVNCRNSFGEKSFDVITSETNPSRRNSIEQITANVLLSGTESTDQDKETSSDNSVRDNESDEKNENARLSASASSVVSIETNSTDSTRRISGSPLRINGIKAIAFDHEPDSADAHDGPDESLDFDRDYSTELKIDIESRVRASIYPETTDSFQQSESRGESPDNSVKIDEEMKTGSVNSLSIVVASRPHSRTTNTDYREPAFQPLDFRQQQTDENSTSTSIFHVSRTFDDSESIDVTTEKVTMATGESFTELPDNPEIHVVTISKIQRHKTPPNDNGAVHDIVKIHEIETTKRLPSRVPRSRMKSRPGLNRVGPIGSQIDKTPGRSKPVTVQCISQLESSDWETTIRGLKSLSSIAKQHPEQLDACQPGTVCRLLGRHVRNLRSQVARTACLAAGDVFTSQARCIDQDLDDIAGPLLQRTADTNKFLRADSNAALDRMIEHIPPHKTITVIVHRGASHQNAIVRAATGRLLLSLVDRLGPDFIMTLPRDVRDKLLGAGAKLLMDGNLDARNNAKMIFKKLSRCDGFRRALTDAVPEATLRHIEKTLRSL